MSDLILEQIADYILRQPVESKVAYATARLCFIDAMGCALRALSVPQCRRMIELEANQTDGLPIPGTSLRLEPVRAAFAIGAMVRWLDYNDTWLAAEWGHPSDNLGALIAACGDRTVGELLHAMIQAYEIQGRLALHNSFNRIGFDHVILVKIASAAVSAHLLGGNRCQIIAALSNAFVDVGPLRTYRHLPNVGPRKSWAAGDATSRGLQLAKWALAGDPGCPTVLSAPHWGLCDVLFKGKPLQLDLPLGSYVMENILLKVLYPAEFHGQTAVEAAVKLHPQVAGRLDEINQITIETQAAAVKIISKEGPLRNAADRDHCLQYMVAVGLLYGEVTPESYEEPIASDPAIETLRKKMVVHEEPSYSQDYLDPSKRSIANRITIEMAGKGEPLSVEIEYPIGHPRRREEALPYLTDKLRRNVQRPEQAELLLSSDLDSLRVKDLLVKLQA
jgi:2-methylcitrate dehydratase